MESRRPAIEVIVFVTTAWREPSRAAVGADLAIRSGRILRRRWHVVGAGAGLRQLLGFGVLNGTRVFEYRTRRHDKGIGNGQSVSLFFGFRLRCLGGLLGAHALTAKGRS
jgi:hypothetical protein